MGVVIALGTVTPLHVIFIKKINAVILNNSVKNELTLIIFSTHYLKGNFT